MRQQNGDLNLLIFFHYLFFYCTGRNSRLAVFMVAMFEKYLKVMLQSIASTFKTLRRVGFLLKTFPFQKFISFFCEALANEIPNQ